MAEYGKPSTYGFLAPEERWKKWESDSPRAEHAIWSMAPGYDFIPEVDLPMFHSMFLDGTHSQPPCTPLYGYLWVRHCGIGTKWVNIALNMPNLYGWEWRFKDGGLYTSFLIVRDEAERKKREVKFKEAIRPYIDDFMGLWEKDKKTLTDMYDRLKEFDPSKATVLDLLHHNWDLDECFRTMYEIHFFGMQTSYSAWVLLEEECKKRFGMNDQSPEFQDMMRKVYGPIGVNIGDERWHLFEEIICDILDYTISCPFDIEEYLQFIWDYLKENLFEHQKKRQLSSYILRNLN